MKKLLLSISMLIVISTFAQEDKTVTLTVSGQGKTKEEAQKNALRSAIEQAFGVFISSKTEILNDNLVKDEIVSVSNGNIQKFDIISEIQLPNNTLECTLKATVSLTKLTTFCESKGIAIEFKGSLFAFNISQMQINELNELKAIQHLVSVIENISKIAFDYKIEKTENPKLFIPRGYDEQSKYTSEMWELPVTTSVILNKNFENITYLLYNTLTSLNMTKNEVVNYKQLNKQTYNVLTGIAAEKPMKFSLRNSNSIEELIKILIILKRQILNTEIDYGVKKYYLNNPINRISKNDFVSDFEIVLIDYLGKNFRKTWEYGCRIDFEYFEEYNPYLFDLNSCNCNFYNYNFDRKGNDPKKFRKDWKFLGKLPEIRFYENSVQTGYDFLGLSFIDKVPGKTIISFRTRVLFTLEELKNIQKINIIKH